MSPIAQLLHAHRIRLRLRQGELARRLGYEQSYISALEVGLKGPPTDEFVERFADALSLNKEERAELAAAAEASDRKLVVDVDTPADVYLLLHALRAKLHRLSATQVRMINDVLSFSDQTDAPVRRKRSRRQEATM